MRVFMYAESGVCALSESGTRVHLAVVVFWFVGKHNILLESAVVYG